MYRNKLLILNLVLILILSLSIIVSGASNKQAPELQKQVDEGELEPLEDRLPEEPLEIEPWDETGEYGGTWNRVTNSEEWDNMRDAMGGFSFTQWMEDGLNIRPNLIKDWEASDDKSSYTLYLREGLKWSDGEAVTTEDILFWFEEMVLNDEHSEPVPDWAIAGDETAEITAIDEYTLQVDFVKPSPLFITRLTCFPNAGIGSYNIVPKHYLKEFHPDYNDEYDNYETFEEKQEWWLNPEHPVLTPWKPVKYEPGERLIMERNPYYYAVDTEGNQLPYIDEVKLNYVQDTETLKLKLTQGESDMQVRGGELGARDVLLLKKREL